MVDMQQRGVHRTRVQIAIDGYDHNLHNYKLERKRRRVQGVRIGVHDIVNEIDSVGVFFYW